MFERINHIKNVGRFYNVLTAGTKDSDPSFKKFNLIYADNGTGKSTISSILKSLWRNEPWRIIERKTIGAEEDSTISVRVDGKPHTFENGKWNKTPEIPMDLFDEEFVSKNVFSPSGVDTTNRRELFNYVVLGEENVEKILEVQELDNFIKGDLKTQIESAENTLKQASGVFDFKILEKIIELSNAELATTRKNIEVQDKIIKHSERISSEKKLSKITDLEVVDYQSTIQENLGSLSHVAEYKTHIQQHNRWIEGGVLIVKEENADKCPFCFQDINDNSAIAAYKEFFSVEYKNHLKDVEDKFTTTQRAYSDAIINGIEALIDTNNERLSFWHQLDKNIPEAASLSLNFKEKVVRFKLALESILKQKKENLLESIAPSETDNLELALENEFKDAIKHYNENIDGLNSNIQVIKDATKNVPELKEENEKKRRIVKCNDVLFHEKLTKSVFGQLKKLRIDKKNKEIRIKKLRSDIDMSSQAILQKYEKSINGILANFGVEFSIEGVKRKSDSTRTESVHFNLRLCNKSFDPNGSQETPYKLVNTLSSGDKSTLAFAFFVAKYKDEDISNTILIFDDPITSLDFFRKQRTSLIISRFAKEARQVMVLTHSDQFVKKFAKEKGKFIHLQKDQISGVSVAFGDKFSDICTIKHDEHFNNINSYLMSPHSVKRMDVMKSIRPYAETVLRQYREDFSGLSLGGMIGKYRKEGICEDYLEKLETVNGIITSESSHGSNNPNADDFENITDDELRIACNIAIEISSPSTLD
tara:strand:- start:2996 stop:5281 length:2286 start_codon:yes stop_codon:yes gene_type:complete